MAYNERLAARVRAVLVDQPQVTEKKMFGGLAFMLSGHMCCGVMGDKLVLRVGADNARSALEQPYTEPFDMTGQAMKTMVVVAGPGIESDASLKQWVQRAVDFVSTLPPK